MKKLLLLPFLLSSALLAENTSFWQVQNVKSYDSLNMRSESIYTSKKVATIPYHESCVINHGCGKNIDLETMMHMQEEDVKAFLEQAQEGWCYVEYNKNKGWVNKTYLKPSSQECH